MATHLKREARAARENDSAQIQMKMKMKMKSGVFF